MNVRTVSRARRAGHRALLAAPIAAILFASPAGRVRADDDQKPPPEESWSEKDQRDMLSGCTESVKERALESFRIQAKLDPEAPIPDEVMAALARMEPAFESTCRCVLERIMSTQTLREFLLDQSVMIREAQKVGTPEGCPLDLDQP